ncbi:protein prenyltransferase alpha subunit repeat-containing protein tempura [Lycorma delicatula]|uniref:protein prenyltransferase alpha subunit repeat-containing protein tempura n=1 Tax=Lycorma delicatula TaxID=130591 RepID=UPI003F5161EF
MQEDSFPAAERIITDIETVLKKDPKLKEFEIIAVTLNENKSPVVVQNHTLGLESWCVRHVFYHSYNRLMDIRQQRWKREDPSRVSRFLTTALLLNPDITTFWNMRRELVLCRHLDPHSELHFTAVVLSRKPKSAEVFSYRKWLIKNLLKDFPADPGLISNEFHVCEIAADRYPNNYYTWNHRIWCLSQFPSDSLKSLNLFVSEWMSSQKWITTHVSDHSGFQYRQHLLLKLISAGCKNTCMLKRTHPNLLQICETSLQSFFNMTNDSYKLSKDVKDSRVNNLMRRGDELYNFNDFITPEYFILGLICSELILNNDLILMYIGHEALWCHRRFLIYTFHENFIKNNCKNLYECDLFRQHWDCRHSHKNNDGVPFEKDLKMEESVPESMRIHLLCFEKIFLARCTDDFQQSKSASKHKVWMENILKVQLL